MCLFVIITVVVVFAALVIIVAFNGGAVLFRAFWGDGFSEGFRLWVTGLIPVVGPSPCGRTASSSGRTPPEIEKKNQGLVICMGKSTVVIVTVFFKWRQYICIVENT
jgi:hypothetical protein